MGVSFAIPIDVAMDVSQSAEKRRQSEPRLVGCRDSGSEQGSGRRRSVWRNRPVRWLLRIQDDGPAAKGGLQVGDVILSMNGQPIVMSADLPHLVGALKAGSKAKLEVIPRR